MSNPYAIQTLVKASVNILLPAANTTQFTGCHIRNEKYYHSIACDAVYFEPRCRREQPATFLIWVDKDISMP